MEGGLSQRGVMVGDSGYGGVDLQEPMPFNFLRHQSHLHGSFPQKRGRNSAAGEDDENCFNEDGADDPDEPDKGPKSSMWHRVKWTDSMVRFLIAAVSYISEDLASESGPKAKAKHVNLQKKGKWKLISKVMAERGFHVSPQQCEDKFNDLNKRYKKLQDILGRGISCQVVENPALLDLMNHLPEKAKECVRKILSSKHLFYEEMCSYHNSNRLHLPHDPALKRSLQLELSSKDDHETADYRGQQSDDPNEEDVDAHSDDCEEYEEIHCRNSAKRKKQAHGPEDAGLKNVQNSLVLGRSFPQQLQNPNGEMSLAPSDGPSAEWMKSRLIQLEQQKLQIAQEMLDLEMRQIKWKRFSRKKDMELEKMKMENERMKLENEKMALELKQMTMGMDNAR